MHNYITLLVGAFVRWIFNGFNSTFQEETGDQKKFNHPDDYYAYQRSTRLIGYVALILLITLFGLLLP